MADDRMRNDDLDRNMGGAGQQNKDNYGKGQHGQQTPGRNKQDDEFATGQRGTGQSQQGEQKHMKDDFGTSGNKDAGQGGRNL